MKKIILRHRSKLPFSAEEVFDWHLNPKALERMIPPWEKVKVISKEGNPSQVGTHILLQTKIGFFSQKWKIKHSEYIEGESFTDIQVKGPFKDWKHIHKVHPIDEQNCEWEDEIHCVPPFFVSRSWIEKKVKKMLLWRHERLKNDLQVRERYPLAPMRILISGSTGLIGSEVKTFLQSLGHDVHALARADKDRGPNSVHWNPKTGEVRKADFEDFDAVIHLAGKNIAGGLWTKKFKERVFISRCRDSWLLSHVLLRLLRPPKTLICASAVGYYGSRNKEILTENSKRGKGFLADLCQKWEEATVGIENRGTRGVHTRFGLVLTAKGGMLGKVLPLFRWGLGAILGSGRQSISWISLDDVVYGIYHALMTKELEGPVNFTSPHPETNRSFSEKVASALRRPLFLRISARFLRLILGRMADEMFLASVRAVPEKLQETGYHFVHPTLEDVLEFELDPD